MAKATKTVHPSYTLELTEDEARTLFTLTHTMICGPHGAGMPRMHTNAIADALRSAGVTKNTAMTGETLAANALRIGLRDA